MINLSNYNFLIMDFDGVFTDNKVLTSIDGTEIISCCKADSLGLDILKKYIKKKQININLLVISTEENKSVSNRLKKLGLRNFLGVKNKIKFLEKYFTELNLSSVKYIYFGNDLNDYYCIQNATFSICPADAHDKIKSLCNYICSANGGNGCIREVVEKIIPDMDLIEILGENYDR